jgi:flavin-dependent dehydrogenase
MRYKTIILGGGPAGCAAAIRLARDGQEVALIERSRYETPRIGELLPPIAGIQLQRLGVAEACLTQIPSSGIVSLWGSSQPYENDFIFSPYGNGWHLDRRGFDESLAELARRAGATVYSGSKVSSISQSDDGHWQVEVNTGATNLDLAGSFLIDATGRARMVARRIGARPLQEDRLIGVVFGFSLPEGWEGDRRMWLESEENGWWYSAVLPEQRMVVAYMTDADMLPSEARRAGFSEPFFHRSLQTHFRLPEGLQPRTVRIVSAASYCMDRIAGHNWAAVGDAAMSWDPLSGYGITKALESGSRAADAILQVGNSKNSALDDYANWGFRQFAGYRRACAEYYRAERRWTNSCFWQRRQS